MLPVVIEIVVASNPPDASLATIVDAVLADAVVIAWVCDDPATAFVEIVLNVPGVPRVTDPEVVIVEKLIPLPAATEDTVPDALEIAAPPIVAPAGRLVMAFTTSVPLLYRCIVAPLGTETPVWPETFTVTAKPPVVPFRTM
jgi:hypothetical protein